MQFDYNKTVAELDRRLCPDKSFDVIKRPLIVGGREAVLYFIDGFIKDEVFEKMLEYLFSQTPDTLAPIKDMSRFAKDKMPYVEVSDTDDIDQMVTAVLSGPALLLTDGIAGALIIDTRTYPTRGIEEPRKDKSLRGSRDGFVETVVFNTALIRRRIRNENLRMEYFQVGESSKVDIALCYVEGIADGKTLEILRKKIKEIRIKGISMTSEAFSEALLPARFANPFPRFKFTERPDYASAAILDGRIAIVLDNSPSVLIIPESFADFFREADDYYFPPLIGTYTRILRMVVSILTVIAEPFYLFAVENYRDLPEWASFIRPTVIGAVPFILQFILLELVVDGLRLASLNTPDTLSNSLGIIGGLLLSEFAVNAGWFIPEAVLITAFVTIAGFAQPSYEMGWSMKFGRVLMLILTQFLGVWGLLTGAVIIIIAMLSCRTVSGRCWLYPIIPFNPKAFIGMFSRPKIGKEEQ